MNTVASSRYTDAKPYEQSSATVSEIAFTLIRIATGAVLIPHGAQKLFGWFGGYGLTGTGNFFDDKLGLHPGIVFAALAGFVEFFGGLALVFGLLTRAAAFGVAVLMGVAIISVHLSNGFFWTSDGFEYPLFWGLIAVAIAINGGGRYSLDHKFGLKF
jgi:putative oxidoreductase